MHTYQLSSLRRMQHGLFGEEYFNRKGGDVRGK